MTLVGPIGGNTRQETLRSMLGLLSILGGFGSNFDSLLGTLVQIVVFVRACYQRIFQTVWASMLKTRDLGQMCCDNLLSQKVKFRLMLSYSFNLSDTILVALEAGLKMKSFSRSLWGSRMTPENKRIHVSGGKNIGVDPH